MADEEKKDEKAEGDEAAAKQPMFSKVGLIVFIVWTILLAGGLAVFLKPSAPPEGEEAEIKTVPMVNVTGAIVNIEAVPITVIVNEATQEAKMINVEISIELDVTAGDDVVKMVESLKPWIKSQLITIVQSSGFTELMKPEAKDRIKTKMKSAIDNRFKQAGHNEVSIKDVLITSFIIAG